jgi:hypothetical protein
MSVRLRSGRTTTGEGNHVGIRNLWCGDTPASGDYRHKDQAAGRDRSGGRGQDCRCYVRSDSGDAGLDLVRRKYSGVAGRLADSSSESPSSYVTPNVPTTECPSDISIGDAGDISTGDLQLNAAEGILC